MNCPACGTPGAYQGIGKPECVREGCEFFKWTAAAGRATSADELLARSIVEGFEETARNAAQAGFKVAVGHDNAYLIGTSYDLHVGAIMHRASPGFYAIGQEYALAPTGLACPLSYTGARSGPRGTVRAVLYANSAEEADEMFLEWCRAHDLVA